MYNLFESASVSDCTLSSTVWPTACRLLRLSGQHLDAHPGDSIMAPAFAFGQAI